MVTVAKEERDVLLISPVEEEGAIVNEIVHGSHLINGTK